MYARIAVLTVAVTVALVQQADARRNRRGDEAVVAESTGVALTQAQVVPPAQNSNTVASTFLDTLNRGREVRLSSADLASGSERGFTEEPIVEPAATSSPSASPTPAKAPSQTSATTKAPTAETWRVQCMASTQREGLVSAKQALEGKVRHPVSILYFAPYYKLMVGQFGSRAEAEKALFDVKGAGYPDAWIARTSAENAN